LSKPRWAALICAGLVLLLNGAIERVLMAIPADGTLIPGLLDFRHAWNRGVSFSLFWQTGDAGRYLLSAALIGVVIFVAILAWRATRTVTAAGFGLVIGGALGNLIDRSLFGAVFDYLSLHLGTTPLFVCNFSDIAISLGVVLLLVDELVAGRR
jgi:signal peptidase II